MPKISRYFVANLSGLILFTPNIGGTSDTRATSLGEAHADVVLKVLKLETRPTPTFSVVSLWRQWSGMPPHRSLTVMLLCMRIITERSPRRGEGGAGRVSEMPYMD